MKILELGCGRAKTPGAIGVDINPRSDADIIHDLNQHPYPFADSEFDRVLCFDVLEHLDNFVPAVEEIWRISKPGGMVAVSGPFMSSVNYFSDPTHKRAFTSRSFDYFIPGTTAFDYAYGVARFRLISVEYDRLGRTERRGISLWLLNWANRNKDLYERRFAFIYPMFQINFELEVLK